MSLSQLANVMEAASIIAGRIYPNFRTERNLNKLEHTSRSAGRNNSKSASFSTPEKTYSAFFKK